jgi:chromosome segregation ATPase
MLRTIAEIRAGRVTIQETDSGTTVTVSVDNAQSTQLLPGERLYTSAEVGNLQASEAELVAAPLRREVASLTRQRENLIQELDHALVQIGNLEKSLAESRELVEFKTRVADEIDQEAERLRGKVRELIQAQEAGESAAVQLLSATLGRISGAVHTPALSDALRTTWQDKKAQAMRKAVREVRHLLGSPVPHQP